jgi:hypothetical protein
VRFFILLITFASWWLLSDYYFAPWPWWVDWFGFMVVSLVVFAGMTTGVYWLKIRRVARRCRPEFTLGGTVPFSIRHWCAMLHEISTTRGGVWADYWNWYRRRLERLGKNAENVEIAADSLGTLWWSHRSAWGLWLLGACLPAVWMALLLIPLHSDVIERVATCAGDPKRIFDVRCVGRDPRTNHPVRETLRLEDGGFRRIGRCAFLSSGTFEISSTSFPRVYRHLVLKCTSGCAVVSAKNTLPVLDNELPVWGGEVSFEWLQTDPELPLGMSVSLIRKDGTLDEIFIEPVKKGDL